MTIEAQLADGTILEFPDNTPDQVIQNTVRQQITNLGFQDGSNIISSGAGAAVQPLPVEGQEFFGKGFAELPEEQRQAALQARQAQLAQLPPEVADIRSIEAQQASGGAGLPVFPEERGETRAAQQLPEFGTGGLLAGEDQATVAALTPAFLATTNTEELGQILTSNFPNIGISQDPGGNFLATNNQTGAQVILNAPGLSRLDVLQGIGLAAAFTPAGRGAALTGPALRGLAGKSAATQAAIETGQAIAGGEFDPEAVAIAGAVAPIGQVLGEKVVAPAAGKILSSFRSIGEKKLLSTLAPSIETLKNSARSIYKEIDDSGALIKPTVFRGLTARINTALRKEGLDFTEVVGDSGTPRALSLLNRISRENPGDISISRIETLRKAAQGVAASTDQAEANLGRVAVDKIDDLLSSLEASSFKGAKNIKIAGKQVGAAFKDARNFWGRARRAEKVNLAIDLAENARSGVENGLRQQFNALAKQIKKGTVKGFSKEELSAINAVAQGNRFRNIITGFGKLGIPEDQASNTLMLSLLGGYGVSQFGGGVTGALLTAGAIAVPTLLRKQARILGEKSADLANAIVRSDGNARKIIKAYMSNTPKTSRNSDDLAALLLQNANKIPDIQVKDTLIDNALFLAKAAATAESAQQE